MLDYARGYGSETDVFAGPDRVLPIFRAQCRARHERRAAGRQLGERDRLPARPLRRPLHEHARAGVRGHGRRRLQAEAGLHRRGLAECQDALAAAARQPTARATGRFGKALRLSGSPIGLAEHVSLPEGIVSGLRDFTIAMWINPSRLRPRTALRLGPERRSVGAQQRHGDLRLRNPKRRVRRRAAGAHVPDRQRVERSRRSRALRSRRAGPRANSSSTARNLCPSTMDAHRDHARGNVGTLYVDGVAVATNTSMTLSSRRSRDSRKATGSAAVSSRSATCRISTRSSTNSRSSTAR